MTRQQYSVKEALNRLLKTLKGNTPASDVPGNYTGEPLSENQSMSDIAELFAGSLPGENLTFPAANYGAITTTDTITCEDLVVNDNAGIDNLDVGTGTFYAGESKASIGGFSTSALFGNGKIVLGVGPASVRPTGTLAHLGGVLFAEDGNLMWLGSSGTVSTVAGS